MNHGKHFIKPFGHSPHRVGVTDTRKSNQICAHLLSFPINDQEYTTQFNTLSSFKK